MPSRPAGPARSGQVRGEHRIPLQRLLHADHRACDRGGGREHRSRGERPARRPGGTDGDRERAEETGVIPLSYNVRSILRRRFSAFAAAGGLGLVVFVFAAVLMLARGVQETLKATGSPRGPARGAGPGTPRRPGRGESGGGNRPRPPAAGGKGGESAPRGAGVSIPRSGATRTRSRTPPAAPATPSSR